jgi:hypothetical protein
MTNPTRYLHTFWPIVTAVVLGSLCIFNQEIGGDSTEHYFHCRWAWAHPELFLSHWGKPLYVLCGALPAQAGIVGLRLFNAACAVATAYIAYRYCHHLRLQYAWFAIPAIVFCNVYFYYTPSGNTETFFAFCYLLSAYLLLKNKPYHAAALASILPYARSEAFFLLPLFAATLLYQRHYKALPLLSLGYLIYGIVGYFALDSFHWVFTKNPYQNAAGYGVTGTWHHFISSAPATYGLPVTYLFVIGIIYGIIHISKKNHAHALLMMAGSFIIYLGIHSYFFYNGIYGSLGLTRVMAAVVPAMGIICVMGLQIITIFNVKWIQIPILVILLFLMIKDPFHRSDYPLKYGAEEQLAHIATQYLIKNNLHNQKIYYGNAIIPLELNKDVYSPQNCQAMWALKQKNHPIPQGAVAVWDSHYCRVDAGVALDFLTKNPQWQPVINIIPKQKLTTMGEQPFIIKIFRYNTSTQKKP